MVCEFFNDLPASAPRIFPQVGELHFGILIVKCVLTLA